MNNIVKGWGSKQFLRYQAIYKLKGVGHTNSGSLVRVPLDLIIGNNNIYDNWEGDLNSF